MHCMIAWLNGRIDIGVVTTSLFFSSLKGKLNRAMREKERKKLGVYKLYSVHFLFKNHLNTWIINPKLRVKYFLSTHSCYLKNGESVILSTWDLLD